jgi:hypothetical protein
LFEGTKFDYASAYAAVIKTLLLGAFYATFLPSVTAISVLGLIALYWAQKYALLRRHANPPTTSSHMQIEVTDDYIEFMILIFNVFSLSLKKYFYL